MIVLFDANSLIFASCYRTRVNGERADDIYYRDLEDATDKYSEQFMKIINDIDEIYDVQSVLTFSGSAGNFRKLITPNIKRIEKKTRETSFIISSS